MFRYFSATFYRVVQSICFFFIVAISLVSQYHLYQVQELSDQQQENLDLDIKIIASQKAYIVELEGVLEVLVPGLAPYSLESE